VRILLGHGYGAIRKVIAGGETRGWGFQKMGLALFGSGRLQLKVAVVFLTTLALGALVMYQHEQNEIFKRQRVAMEVASIHGHLLQEQTARSLSATYALAAVLRQGSGRIDDFEEMATQMLPLYGGISSLQIAPGGVIRKIVPLAGNEAAIGHDLLSDPERNKEAFAAVETRRLTLAGPFTLRQGGLAVVGRLPVFLPDAAGKERFWGFTTALIRIPDLLAASRLGTDAGSGYDYELSRIHPDSGQREVFWASSPGAELHDPLAYRIEVPNGVWTLNLAAPNGWSSSTRTLSLAALGILLVSAMAGFLAYRVLREPDLLARQVEERTRELSLANDSLQAEIIEHWQTELALRESEGRLEARVEERTSQLAKANAALQEEAVRQKALVQSLEEAQNQLLQSEMMASVGQLAAGMAHEINNPLGFIGSNLNTMRTYSQGLLEIIAAYEAATAGLDEFRAVASPVDAAREKFDLAFVRQELPQMLADTEEGIARISRIVQDLKDFSHVDDSEWQMLDLNQGIDSTLSLMANELAPKVEVLRDYGSVPRIECLAFQINQVFLGLLRNALQAIPEKGVITVRTYRDAEWVVAEFADTGIGIAPEHMARLFDVFFTTKPVGQGTGLGLSLAYSVVKRHGGNIEVDSAPGRGARFRVRLPVSRLA